MLRPFTHLLVHGRAADHPVYHDGQHMRIWSDFAAQVARLAAYLEQQAQVRWLLSYEAADQFAIALLALLASGKQIVIPPNFQPGTLAQVQREDSALLDDIDMATLAPAKQINTAAMASARIELYTSGSTGRAKCVSKTLAQLEREIAVLESMWGKTLGNACIVATVPHHHIYGLLFRLLWPLAAGRPFDVVQSAHPDTLQQRLQTLKTCALVSSPAQLSRLPQLIALKQLQPWPCLIFSSGGPLAASSAQHWHAHGGTAPVEIYGSTETGGMAWRQQITDAWWTPLPGVRIEQVEGAALLHSPFLDTSSAWRLDDAIEITGDQRFRLLGRTDRIVKIEEKRVALHDIENCLHTHPWIEQAAAVALVVATGCEGTRQSLGIVMTLTTDGQTALAAQGRQHLRSQFRQLLAAHFDAVLLPRYWRYVDSLPYTAQGKLPQATLQALFAK